jgi:hypothetical protein
MSEKVQKALELFNSGFNCSQAVMGTFCRQFGIDEQLSIKLTLSVPILTKHIQPSL